MFTVVALVAACGGESGPDAPPPQPSAQICGDDFCLIYPGDWVAESGSDYISLRHPGVAGTAATVGFVDMEGLRVAAGESWPAPVDEVVRSFWDLLDEDQDADVTTVDVLDDGSVRSNGTLEGVRMWHRLIPISESTAVGVEVRAPNPSWQGHADAILAGVSIGSPPGS